jgi:hypothetical protein
MTFPPWARLRRQGGATVGGFEWWEPSATSGVPFTDESPVGRSQWWPFPAAARSLRRRRVGRHWPEDWGHLLLAMRSFVWPKSL